MNQVTQPSAKPTNKLTAAMLAAAVLETARILIEAGWPGLTDGPFWVALYPMAILGAGYLIRDEDNTP